VSAAAQGAPDSRPGVAVFPFTNGGSYGPSREDFSDLQIGIQQMLLTEIAQNSGLRVVDRSILRGILEEQELARTGQVDAQTAARVGKLVGARYVITGVFTDLFGNFRLDGRIVDVETGEVLKTEEVREERAKIYELIVELASRITTGVELPPLAAAIREARKARQIPAEAVRLYSQAQVLQDGGDSGRAIELYRLLADRFPQLTEAREALRQLTEG
jgi:TolB-like protein